MRPIDWPRILQVSTPQFQARVRNSLSRKQALSIQLSQLRSKTPTADFGHYYSILKDKKAVGDLETKLRGQIDEISQQQQAAFASAISKLDGQEKESLLGANALLPKVEKELLELELVRARIQAVNKPPEEFTIEDVHYIQPETKTEFIDRVRRNDLSTTFAMPVKEFEAELKSSAAAH